MQRILIIGAGFSGAVTAVHLLRRGQPDGLEVILVNRSGAMARGIAYGTQSAEHMLNVPAGNMSALADDPEHFLRFCRRTDERVTASSFVSRHTYGDYLECLLHDAEHACPDRTSLTRIVGEVTDIGTGTGARNAQVTLADGQRFEVNQIVLAFGHYPPNNPHVADAAFYNSVRYVRDPWRPRILETLDLSKPTLLLGTGLTAVDVSINLLKRPDAAPIVAMSRRGLLPQSHRPARPVVSPNRLPEFTEHGKGKVRYHLHEIRKHVQLCADAGDDWREVVGALRPITQLLWQQFPASERRRFVRHLHAFWDIHRHRVAPEAGERFQQVIASGALTIQAGRVTGYHEMNDGVQVTYQRRGAHAPSVIEVGHVINCTGPSSDLKRVDDPLIKKMLATGLVHADPLGLGLEVAENCAVMTRDGEVSNVLYYVGPLLKARYWEATAVPELRVFAYRLANTLLDISTARAA